MSDPTLGFPVPTGHSVTQNIQTAQTATAGMDAAQKMIWFFDQVRQGGDMDYKQLTPDKRYYEDFGNYNYGAVGRAIGIPSIVLDIGAGVQQYFGDNQQASKGTPLSARVGRNN